MRGGGVLYAVDSGGILVDIARAEKGAPKGTYLCIECRQAVYKTEGESLRHHFRHWSEKSGGSSGCSATAESIEHAAAKRRLADTIERTRPRHLTLSVRCGGWSHEHKHHTCQNRVRLTVELPLYDEVLVEKSLERRERPDVLLIANRRPILALEIYHSHEVTWEKAKRYAEIGLPWIEVTARSVHKPRDGAYVHRQDDYSIATNCSTCEAERANWLARQEHERQLRLRAARRIGFARHGDRPMLPRWARDDTTYSCPVCDAPVAFDKSENAFLHEHARGCSTREAERIAAALKLRHRLKNREPYTYRVRCRGQIETNGKWKRCSETVILPHALPQHDALKADEAGVRAVKDGSVVWQAALVGGRRIASNGPTVRIHASAFLEEGATLPAPDDARWWCGACDFDPRQAARRPKGRGIYGPTASDEEHVAQLRHNHKLALQLLQRSGVPVSHVRKRIGLALAPCTNDICSADVLLVANAEPDDLPDSLLRLVRIKRWRGQRRTVLDPLCPDCGENQTASPYRFPLDAGLLDYWSRN